MPEFRKHFLRFISLSTIVFGAVWGEKSRNVTITYNDGCDIPECRDANVNGSFYNLVHFRALGETDTIHHVWSTIGAPSLLVARTESKATMKVDWKKVVSREAGAITFRPEEDVLSVSAFVISRLLEYRDDNDTADITKSNTTRSVDVSNLVWSNVTINSTEKSALFMTEQGEKPAVRNGSLALKVQTIGVEGRGTDLPHLQHLPNSTEFSLVLDDLEQNFKKTRYALEMLIARDQPKQKAAKTGIVLEDIASIDDEYTPAVFKTYQVVLDKAGTSEKGNFMQWKPIVYTSSDRNTESSTPIKTYDLNSTNLYINDYSIVHAFYTNLSSMDLGSFNISFGISKDNFYNATKYYVWTSMAGYGSPPSDTLSILIISIISVGLGVPVILIMVGGIVVACQKRFARQKENSLSKYTSIN